MKEHENLMHIDEGGENLAFSSIKQHGLMFSGLNQKKLDRLSAEELRLLGDICGQVETAATLGGMTDQYETVSNVNCT
jgi:hypothetical protein